MGTGMAVILMILFVCVGIGVVLYFAFSSKLSAWRSSDYYDVVLQSFSLSEDGKTLTLKVSRRWETGSVEGYYPEYEENGLFIDFETAVGNSMVPREITVDLSPECNSIYFNRSEGKYMLMLRKDEAGQWSDTSGLYIFRERETEDEEYDEEGEAFEYDEEYTDEEV